MIQYMMNPKKRNSKQLIIFVIKYAEGNFGVKCEWARVGALIKRVGYNSLVSSMVRMNKELKFPSGDNFLNYLQKVATEKAIKELENVEESND